MLTILVVDDEPAIRALLVEVLSEEGYAVVTAHNGRSALDLATRDRPDLVLTDVMMPELDGLGLIRRFRATPHLTAIPVVLMSAVNGALPTDADAIAVVPKPFDLDHVLAVIARALRANGR